MNEALTQETLNEQEDKLNAALKEVEKLKTQYLEMEAAKKQAADLAERKNRQLLELQDTNGELKGENDELVMLTKEMNEELKLAKLTNNAANAKNLAAGSPQKDSSTDGEGARKVRALEGKLADAECETRQLRLDLRKAERDVTKTNFELEKSKNKFDALSKASENTNEANARRENRRSMMFPIAVEAPPEPDIKDSPWFWETTKKWELTREIKKHLQTPGVFAVCANPINKSEWHLLQVDGHKECKTHAIAKKGEGLFHINNQVVPVQCKYVMDVVAALQNHTQIDGFVWETPLWSYIKKDDPSTPVPVEGAEQIEETAAARQGACVLLPPASGRTDRNTSRRSNVRGGGWASRAEGNRASVSGGGQVNKRQSFRFRVVAATLICCSPLLLSTPRACHECAQKTLENCVLFYLETHP